MSHTLQEGMEKGLKMGILKKYEDGYVMPELRYSQIQTKILLPYQLLIRELVGFVRVDSAYWIVYREGNAYFKTFFAKNALWWKAITSELEYRVIGMLRQIHRI